MSSTQLSGVFVTCEHHGCVYTVCTEGELFYAPMYTDGSINMMEFDIVDMEESDADIVELESIQSALIDMMQRAGIYFRQPVGHC